MSFARIARRNKPKSRILTLRLSEEEHRNLTELKKALEFRSMAELILFGVDVVEFLRDWSNKDYHFYVGDPNEKDFKEIEFELSPEFTK